MVLGKIHVSKQILQNEITSFNPIPSNALNDRTLDLHLRELLTVQGKHTCMSQDKRLPNLQQPINSANGPPYRILTAMEAEKKASMGSKNESSLAEILSLFVQVILLLEKAITICSYMVRFSISML